MQGSISSVQWGVPEAAIASMMSRSERMPIAPPASSMTTTVEPEGPQPHILVETDQDITAQGGYSMSATSNETGNPSRKGARASRATSKDPIEPEETDETDRALIERRRRRRVQKKQLIARAQRLLDDAPSPDRA